MSFRFRKSISLGKGTRINFSKSGLGVSTGIKGFRTGIGSRGSYSSINIPGTGLSYTSYGGKGRRTKSDEGGSGYLGCLMFFIVIGCIVLFFYHPYISGAVVLIGIISYVIWTNTPKQKAMSKLLKANNKIEKGQYSEAITLLQNADLIYPNDPQIRRSLGQALFYNGQYEEALSFLKEAGIADDFNLKHQLAYCYYQVGLYNAAIEVLQSLLSPEEPDLQVVILLAKSYTELKQYELAIEVYKKAPLLKRNLDDDLLSVHYNLGSVYDLFGDKKNAQKHYKRVYAQDQNYRDVAKKIEL